MKPQWVKNGPKQTKYDMLRENKDTLNRKPLRVTCSNCQDFLFLMMSISGGSFQKIRGYGFQNPEYLDDSILNDSYMYLCLRACACLSVSVTPLHGYVHI